MTNTNPAEAATRNQSPPGEWGAIARLYIGFASDEALWGEGFAPAQDEIAALANFFADPAGPGQPTHVTLFVASSQAAHAARARVIKSVEIVEAAFGDIWLRDTGPIFARNAAGALQALRFGFNGWGGKYQLPGDAQIGDHLARHANAAIRPFPFILEGGAVEWDGAGTLLTTRQCLLNPNRNPDWGKGAHSTEAAAETALREAFGISKILWLDEGLVNDHTDGHIDNLARFIAPGRIVTQYAQGKSDPNAALYGAIARALGAMKDAGGRSIEVVTIPSPGLVADEAGEPMPASHMNFLRANGRVAVPVYDPVYGEAARAALAAFLPGEHVVALPALAILTGGGAFHCISQHVPPVPGPDIA